MDRPRSIKDWMEEKGLRLPDLQAALPLEPKVVEAMVLGRYTASPRQRQQVAAVLGVTVDQIAWSYAIPVSHVYGHGPQFGRTP